MSQCQNGHDNHEGAVFCGTCGSPIAAAPLPQAAEAVPPAYQPPPQAADAVPPAYQPPPQAADAVPPAYQPPPQAADAVAVAYQAPPQAADAVAPAPGGAGPTAGGGLSGIPRPAIYAGIGVLVLLLVGAFVLLRGGGSSGPTVTVQGQFQLTDAATAAANCVGQGQYAYARAGTKVTMSDASSGKSLGSSTFSAGSDQGDGECDYFFTIPKVSSNKPNYIIKIAGDPSEPTPLSNAEAVQLDWKLVRVEDNSAASSPLTSGDGGGLGLPPGATQACDDGSTPTPNTVGSYTCANGTLVQSTSPPTPAATAAATDGGAGTGATCDDGSSPVVDAFGDETCTDGSTPS